MAREAVRTVARRSLPGPHRDSQSWRSSTTMQGRLSHNGETRMSNEKRGIALPTLLAFTIAGMAFTASLVLAYYATHPERIGR